MIDALRHYIRRHLPARLTPCDRDADERLPPRRQEALRRTAPAGSVRLVWGSAAALVLLLLWAGLAEVDELARGTGQVVPSQRVQLVQNLEGGILQGIPVREGQRVEQGDVVARIDNETAGSQYREALARSLEHQAAIARLEALIGGGDAVYPPEVLAEPELTRRQNDILAAARAQTEAELHVLALQRELRTREAAEQEERRRQLTASLELALKQRDLAHAALQAKAYSALEFLNLEQRVQNLKAELAGLEHSIPRLHTAAREMEERLALRKAELEAQYRREINEIQTRLLSLREMLTAGSDRVQRTEMRSPVRGVVKRIHTHTVGGVVAPGATLMEIVPLDDTLIIEARFSPTDIAFLYPGQKATVRLTAYDFAIYGGLAAEVEQIGADTVEGRQGEYFYAVKVRTDRNHLEHKGQTLPIMVGMLAEVDVLTGKKTVLDYLLKPLLKARQRALRER